MCSEMNRIEFDCGQDVKAGALESERHSAGAAEQFDGGKPPSTGARN